MRTCAAIFLFLALCGTLNAQYEVSVTTIPVWVKVQDRSGTPVTGLTEQDFEIFEDGKKVESNCFEEVNLDQPGATTAGATEPAVQQPQKFVLLLDLYNTTPREYAAVKPALQDFLDTLAGRKVEVMLAALMPDRRLGIISNFTNDLRRIRILLDYAKANPKRDVHQKSRTKSMQDAMQNSSQALAKTADTTIENSSVDSYQTARNLASVEVESSRYTLRALETFAENLARMELKDHTSLILVSGGFSVDPGRRYFNMADAYVSKAGDQNAPSRPELRQTGFSFEDELHQSIGKLNRTNTTLYTLDTRGVLSEKEYQDSLVQIAQETGGIPFYNSDNFNVGLDRVQEDIKHQYLLCYSPPEHKTLGEYHSIKVNVKRTGVSARYRDGYWE